MNRILRTGLLLGIIVLAAQAGWWIVGIMRSDAALDRGDHAAALRWRPNNPVALLRLATARHAAGDMAGAETLARRLLTAAPADGRGYRILAQVAEARGEEARAAMLYDIAVRRAPRDLQARAWLAQRALAAGDYKTALVHVDRVLRMSSGQAHARLYPVLTQLASDPTFADALAESLGSHPPWRDGILAALHAADKDGPRAADQVLAALQRRNDLDAGSTDAWIEALIRQGRWGEALARWAAPQLKAGQPIPLLFNGNFASAPQGAGFDWRLPSVAGVLASIEPLDRGGGMLHLRFLGRRVQGGAVASHALVLAPGTYRLQWRERIDGLRADEGLAWRVACAGQPQILAVSEPGSGSRPWRLQSLDFTVPSNGCGGQWLHLANAGNAGSGQVLSGDLWYADMKVSKLNKTMNGNGAVDPAM